MRPLTFGVLCSVGPPKSVRNAPTPRRGATPTGEPESAVPTGDFDRDIEATFDLESAADLTSALRALGHAARPLPVDEDLDLTLRQSDVDACLLALHGRRGGSGEVQSLLSVRGLPFVGPGAGAVALAFDKVRSRQMLAYHNLPVLPAVALGPQLKASERALALLGWPCVVKPRRGAHGLGLAPLDRLDEIQAAIERALEVDEQIVLERKGPETEIQVVLLGERVIGSIEVVGRTPTSAGDHVCPPRMSRGRLDGIHNLARRCVAALGLHEGLTRVDLLVSDRHNEVVLEVEPLPSLAKSGVVARVALAAGMSYEALVAGLVDRLMLRVPETRTDHAVMLQ